ncbi:MAG: hypothetical protein HYV97_05030 [Bdellovibrio sp.]|nr:hypothetical protein [Bdellovibrio sp.]
MRMLSAMLIVSLLMGTAWSKTITVKLAKNTSAYVFNKLDKSIAANAQARQTHTMGEFIEGTIRCSNEYADENSDQMVKECVIELDNSDKGPNG